MCCNCKEYFDLGAAVVVFVVLCMCSSDIFISNIRGSEKFYRGDKWLHEPMFESFSITVDTKL